MSQAKRVVDQISASLDEDDDARLWAAVIDTIDTDIRQISDGYTGRAPLLIQLGRCSHWLRPHQTRWTAAGGFAWPTGYGDEAGGYSSSATPRFDWSLAFSYDAGEWHLTKGRPGRRPLVLRVAVPSRTQRHPQAAVYTQWAPGSPRTPNTKQVRFLGFRRSAGQWKLVADSLPLWDPGERSSSA